jgi:hypothetical protein
MYYDCIIAMGGGFMPKLKYGFSEKADWFKKYYEERKTVQEIAKEYAKSKQIKIDARTIVKGIEEVKTAKSSEAAEMELIKSAIHLHQSELNGTIDKMKMIAKVPDIANAPIAWTTDTGFEEKVEARLTEVKNMQEFPIYEKLGREYRVKLDLLGQHLRGEPFWRLFSMWNKTCYALTLAQLELQALLVRLLKKDFNLQSSMAGHPYVLPQNLGPLYYNNAVFKSIGQPYQEIERRDYYAEIGSKSVGYTKEIARVPKNEAQFADLLYKVWLDLSSSPEAHKVGQLFTRLNEISTKVEMQAEEVLLSHYIPGKCRACKRYRK